MYLFYLDESGDPGPRGSSHLVLAGAALTDVRWRNVYVQLDALIAKYFATFPRPREVHMAELRAGKGLYRTLTPQQRTQLTAEVCELATDLLPSEFRMFAVVAEKASWFADHPGKTGDDLYLNLFEDITSRFDLFLRRKHAEGAPS